MTRFAQQLMGSAAVKDLSTSPEGLRNLRSAPASSMQEAIAKRDKGTLGS